MFRSEAHGWEEVENDPFRLPTSRAQSLPFPPVAGVKIGLAVAKTVNGDGPLSLRGENEAHDRGEVIPSQLPCLLRVDGVDLSERSGRGLP